MPATAEAITRRLEERGIRRPGCRSNTVSARIAADVSEFSVTPGTLDARPVPRELDGAIPRDWDIIAAGGHCFSFAMTHLKGRRVGKYHVPIDFGAIGSGLSEAIGVAVARVSDEVLLIDGDGSLYISTSRNWRPLNNDGYGAESHKFRATGGNSNHAIHGRGDLAAIARGFGSTGPKSPRSAGWRACSASTSRGTAPPCGKI